MKKRVIPVFLCCVLVVLSFAACGGEKWQRQKATGTAAACAESAIQTLDGYLKLSVTKADAEAQLSDLVDRMESMGLDKDYGTAGYAAYYAIYSLSGFSGLDGATEADVQDAISILNYQLGRKAAKLSAAPDRLTSGDEAVFTNPAFSDLPFTFGFSGASDGFFTLSLTFDRMYGTTAKEALSHMEDVFRVASTHGSSVSVTFDYQSYKQSVFSATIYRDGDGYLLSLHGPSFADSISTYTSLDDLPSLIKDAVRYAG